ncbi:hypothetical protein EVAR_55235_1 [Eumeta japonica]|uniref:Uncharacterized protein n=1 Tax=Eumeta variegata TaxID=151549 RepID=A0A4C1Y7T3_EUMVA|nr:hypothetical protein EVAR_55235_1 [Eumeta japonica]
MFTLRKNHIRPLSTFLRNRVLCFTEATNESLLWLPVTVSTVPDLLDRQRVDSHRRPWKLAKSKGVTSALPASWARIGYLIEGEWRDWRGAVPPEFSLIGRNVTAEAVTSRLHSCCGRSSAPERTGCCRDAEYEIYGSDGRCVLSPRCVKERMNIRATREQMITAAHELAKHQSSHKCDVSLLAEYDIYRKGEWATGTFMG